MLTCLGRAAKARWGPAPVGGRTKDSAGFGGKSRYELVLNRNLRRRKRPKHRGVGPRAGIVSGVKVLARFRTMVVVVVCQPVNERV
jgi:hypothetical protein